MSRTRITTLLSLLTMSWIVPIDSFSLAKIIDSQYAAGSSFLDSSVTSSSACMCSCILHPHCLSFSTASETTSRFSCQLFATYPTSSSQLSWSKTSSVSILTNRTLSSVYLNNGSGLSHPSNLFSNSTNPWIPAFLLRSGNNQSFLWLNSSNLTTLIEIPALVVNQSAPHWFSVLISQWNQNLFQPSEVALAFIVNQTTIIDFLVFNASKADIHSWFSILRLVSNQYWSIAMYRNTTVGQAQMKSIYTDADCTRSFNCNFKYSTNGCTYDFKGYFFLYDGYQDRCIAAVRNISQVPVPSIFYSPASNLTAGAGSLDYFSVADGLMGFVHWIDIGGLFFSLFWIDLRICSCSTRSPIN